MRADLNVRSQKSEKRANVSDALTDMTMKVKPRFSSIRSRHLSRAAYEISEDLFVASAGEQMSCSLSCVDDETQ